jgi:hypothetical protein
VTISCSRKNLYDKLVTVEYEVVAEQEKIKMKRPYTMP